MIWPAYLAWLPDVVLSLALVELVGLLDGLEAEPSAGALHGADALRLGLLGPAEEAAVPVELPYPCGQVGVKLKHCLWACSRLLN